MLKDLTLKSRSFRRFDGSVRLQRSTLEELVDLARYCPSASNLQGLKFYLVHEEEELNQVFLRIKFGGYLTGWTGPTVNERPTGYIILLGDGRIKKQFDTDAGIAAQTIMLGATEKGYGGCIVGAIQREELSSLLELPEYYSIVLVLALGKPAERVVIDNLGKDGNIKYFRDKNDVHHVPKRLTTDLILDRSKIRDGLG